MLANPSKSFISGDTSDRGEAQEATAAGAEREVVRRAANFFTALFGFITL
jgi:hypothetical protein